ncbi:sirohydrochlorin chelatase [Leptothoe sp. PORK10 BA2]|uniref:sirohydrochlorin chelatase n=1 Tax=Leptothoe sp. PORK10 BA2 TaxID=3110254 RepID=UPI002B1EB619|nr:CbiX/SirB N-terminal domain-containing protein [Leptothoe sp. PORK10 BA2]MEA5463680.1 CbiX/SirB N-terminal domain-containing protein [Leptothoe sp. PORK10 BA2]
MTSTAYLLISHGSRDPRHQAAINRLAQLVRERLNPSLISPWSSQPLGILGAKTDPSGMTVFGARAHVRKAIGKDGVVGGVVTTVPIPKVSANSSFNSSPVRLPEDRLMVGTAVLEFGLLPLHQQICEFGRRLSSAGIKRLCLVPLFLLRGKHVMEDIPAAVALAQTELAGVIDVELGAHIGGHQQISDLIAHRFSQSPEAGRLLVAHGSRRVRGNRAVDALAKSLGTAVAYWTTESDIENQVIALMQQGCSTVTIFPYFLFAGSTTDAVAHLTEELAERFPRTTVRLLPPLGAMADVANLVVETLGHKKTDVYG